MGWRPMKERGQIKYHQSKQKRDFSNKNREISVKGHTLHIKVNIDQSFEIFVKLILHVYNYNMRLLKHKPSYNEASQI